MIIAEATTKSGKLVQVEDTGKMTDHEPDADYMAVEDFRIHYIIIDGVKETKMLKLWQAKKRFFRVCQEGCEQ